VWTTYYSPSFDRRPDKGDRDLSREGQIRNIVSSVQAEQVTLPLMWGQPVAPETDNAGEAPSQVCPQSVLIADLQGQCPFILQDS
jgi:hypothetical protein